MNEPKTTVPPSSEPLPERNGNGDRIDHLVDSVDLLTRLSQRAATVAELAHQSAERAREGIESVSELVGNAIAEMGQLRGAFAEHTKAVQASIRETKFVREDSGRLRTEIVGLREDGKRMARSIESLERAVGRWPQSPDDTGSGLAGAVARASQHELEPPLSSTPPALKWFQKKHPRIAMAVGGIVTFGFVVWQIVQLIAGHH